VQYVTSQKCIFILRFFKDFVSILYISQLYFPNFCVVLFFMRFIFVVFVKLLISRVRDIMKQSEMTILIIERKKTQ